MGTLRRLALAVLLTALAVVFGVVGTAAASSDPSVPEISVPAGGRAPIELASTGFDITVPVIIGLSTLIVGIGFVSWAFLRGSRAPRRRH